MNALISKAKREFFKDPRSKIPNLISQNLNYYPPDISAFKLAQQDKSLSALKLIDYKLLEKKIAQDRLVKRGKSIRVDVINGPLPKPESSKTKKKKK